MDDRLAGVSEALIDLDERRVLALVDEAYAEGATSLSVIRACELGMRGVGDRYEREEYFLSGLIMAGEIFRQVMARSQPGLERETAGNATGRVLLGTVAGDIHNIGKNLVRMALRSYGFTVHDAGVDVAPNVFLEQAGSFRPDVVGLSCLMSTSIDPMRETIAILRAQGSNAEHQPPIVIGGATMDELICDYVGADWWTTDVMEGVRFCQRVTSDAEKGGTVATPS
jgi:methanogenic corrinoid protein MtbC1